MKFLVKALRDAPPDYGDRKFSFNGELLKKGDEIEISAAGFETVMSNRQYREIAGGDAFELIREIPESPEEEARIKPRLMKAELMSETKADLVKQAEKLDIPTNQNKEPLADAIVEAKVATFADPGIPNAGEAHRGAEPIVRDLTAASGQVNPKAKKR